MSASKPYGIIYSATNLVDGKVYVGQTTRSIDARWAQHCRNVCCVKLHRAIKRHGADGFSVRVIDSAGSKDELDAKEVFWIESLQSRDPLRGYNLRAGGSFGKHSEESRRLMSEKVRAAYERPEMRMRLSAAHTGKKHSPERVAKVAAANTGKTHSNETKQRLSTVRSALWRQDETRHAMQSASLAARADPAYKAAVAAKTKQQWSDPEKRARVLAAQAAGKAALLADPVRRAEMIAKRTATREKNRAEAAAK